MLQDGSSTAYLGPLTLKIAPDPGSRHSRRSTVGQAGHMKSPNRKGGEEERTKAIEQLAAELNARSADAGMSSQSLSRRAGAGRVKSRCISL
jgi:hypothetical protein